MNNKLVPVGTCYLGKSDNGRVGKIWLQERNEYFEMWCWSVGWEDGSGWQTDWSTSYELCRKEIPIWNLNGKTIRFKKADKNDD